MGRNHHPFTKRQIDLLAALRSKLIEITDPDPEIITSEDFEWSIACTKDFGKIPKIRFRPSSTRIKAEVIERAELISHEREEQLEEIRLKYGIRNVKYEKARLFESEWNNIMLKAKKAVLTLALLNYYFAPQGQPLSQLIEMLQSAVREENGGLFKPSDQLISSSETSLMAEKSEFESHMPYDEVLAELD